MSLSASLTVLLLVAPPGFNYDEAAVPEYELPSVLGEADSPEDWPDRRAELIRLFEQHVYGVAPPAPTHWDTHTIHETAADDAGALWDRVEVTTTKPSGEAIFTFPFTVVRPKDASLENPAPVFVVLVHPARINEMGSREEDSTFFPWKTILAAGYAAILLPVEGLAPDDNDTFDSKLLAAYGLDRASFDGERPGDACGGLAAWGWGASRALDYCRSQPELDGSRVAVIGHSRGGKAAWWAAARDPRFSFGISNNSGCGGAALSRRRFGETVARINQQFPRWFCPRFKEYDDNEDALPVDQHMLAAAMAPRPVYAASATEDDWADPKGEFLSLVAANPAFELFGDEPWTPAMMPAAGESLTLGRRGYHLRPGGHGLDRFDWDRYLTFAKSVWENDPAEANR